MRLLPLIAATYFMVSGGPYGIEDILGGAGYGWAIAILLVLPIVWSLPTALMIGELASPSPPKAASTSGCAARSAPSGDTRKAGSRSPPASSTWPSTPPSSFSISANSLPRSPPAARAYAWSLAVVLLCSLWNLRGAPAVGDGSVGSSILLLAPFVVFVVLGFLKGLTLHPAIQWSNAAASTTGFGAGSAFSTAVLVAMWNYMGWDNASTIAQEVENPQRNYPRAMIVAAVLTAVTYILPLAAMALAGLSAASFSTGDWAEAARAARWPWPLGRAPRNRRRRRRLHHRRRHVQRTADELHAPSHGHGP